MSGVGASQARWLILPAAAMLGAGLAIAGSGNFKGAAIAAAAAGAAGFLAFVIVRAVWGASDRVAESQKEKTLKLLENLRADPTQRVPDADPELAYLAPLNAILDGAAGRVASAESRASKVRILQERVRGLMPGIAEVQGLAHETRAHVEEMNATLSASAAGTDELSRSSEETSSAMLEMVATVDEVNVHTDSLSLSVSETAHTTEAMVAAIREIDSNVEHLNAAVTEVSAAMAEMEASIHEVESGAAQSRELSEQVASDASTGRDSVSEVVRSMGEIAEFFEDVNRTITELGERSQSIGGILNVIEDIAEQTSLLALNAAIIAAQAGEHGRSFAVVADEVRTLADRTASSTKEISQLIESIQEETGRAIRKMESGQRTVTGGVDLSNRADGLLARIMESARTSSEQVSSIARATREQGSGAQNIYGSVERIQTMVSDIVSATAHQRESSEQILSAMENMREMTEHIRRATKEQADAGKFISGNVERVSELIHRMGETAQAAPSGSVDHLLGREVDLLTNLEKELKRIGETT